jgi:hypothetical protein
VGYVDRCTEASRAGNWIDVFSALSFRICPGLPFHYHRQFRSTILLIQALFKQSLCGVWKCVSLTSGNKSGALGLRGATSTRRGSLTDLGLRPSTSLHDPHTTTNDNWCAIRCTTATESLFVGFFVANLLGQIIFARHCFSIAAATINAAVLALFTTRRLVEKWLPTAMHLQMHNVLITQVE